MDDETKARAARLLKARRYARLTQTELARRIGRSQTLVCQAEKGVARVGERYVRLVLEACKLRPSWGAPKGKRSRDGGQKPFVVGLDPETMQPVLRGTKRDLELARKYVWWSNGWARWQ
jgi:transcriptional regulator with XRE-family HTH domain